MCQILPLPGILKDVLVVAGRGLETGVAAVRRGAEPLRLRTLFILELKASLSVVVVVADVANVSEDDAAHRRGRVHRGQRLHVAVKRRLIGIE